MTKTLLATALATFVLAAQPLTARAYKSGAFQIVSESQFQRDYAQKIERQGNGVYQVKSGALAGTVITMGEAGLAFDLAELRARKPTSVQERLRIQARIKQLEAVRDRYKALSRLQARAAASFSGSASASTDVGVLPCVYYDANSRQRVWYNSTAFVGAYAERSADYGGSGIATGDARAFATASGQIGKPANATTTTGWLTAFAYAENAITRRISERAASGASPRAATDTLYSGPRSTHNLIANSRVWGSGDCYGYVSVSDALR